MSDKPCPVGRWLRRKEARPGELIDAALDLFVERGFAATKMEDIARRAGVTKGTAYLYFPNKEELFRAAIRDSLLPRLAEGEDLLARDFDNAWERLKAIVRHWWSLLSEPRVAGIPKLMCAECGNFPELAGYYKREVIDRAIALIHQAIAIGVRERRFRVEDPEYTTKVVVAPLVMSMLWQHSFARYEDEPTDLERFLDAYFSLLQRGLDDRTDQENPT